MKNLLFLFFFIFPFFVLGQTQTMKGKVSNQQKEALVGVNIYLKNTPTQGTTTDENGAFELEYSAQEKDSFFISYTGYETMKFATVDVLKFDFLPIQLKEKNMSLKTFAVVGKRSIAEEFSVQQLDRLDIYKNPLAAADPLRAITVLPASTNTDESANPSLRGSNSTRTRVLLNGVPIYKPVRNSQINGLGNFSLFNTELIDNQTVYASNPPLIYANSSAGLVEIETQKKLSNNNTQVALSLANVGLMTSRKLPKEGLLQIYGNYQFSKPFLALNSKSLNFLKDFSTRDVGFHWRQKIGVTSSLTLFSYAIQEDYGAEVQQLNFRDIGSGGKKRIFNILSFDTQKNKHFFSLKHGNNFSIANYQFGNLNSTQKERQFYFSANHKYYFSEQFSVQSGLTYDYNKIRFNSQSPLYYYAMSEAAPTISEQATVQLHDPQYYAYGKWNANEKLIFGAGLRGNLSGDPFLSYQASTRYLWKPQHSFLLAGGKYHNYNIPNYLNQHFDLLSSYQWALEYAHQSRKWEVQVALFQKWEKGDVLNYDRQSSNARQFSGVETSIRFQPQNNWTFSIANTYLNAQISSDEGIFRASNDLNYFIKAGIQYDNLAIGSFSLFYLQRPGTYFTPVTNAIWQEAAQDYEPIFATDWNSTQLNTYQSLNLAISKVLAFDNQTLIIFLNINNLLDQENQQYQIYNSDYSTFEYENFSRRILYFGVVWAL